MKLALLTIGQSPRTDVLSDVGHLLKGVDYFERGLLDGMPLDEIERVYGPRPGDEVYVSRLRSGGEVKLSKNRVVEGMKKLVAQVEKDADLILIMCTGDFDISSSRPVILPSRLLMGVVGSLRIRKLGVLVPLREQLGMAKRRWSPMVDELVVEYWSPYSGSEEQLRSKARRLRGVDLVVMDCFGYSTRHAAVVREVAGGPVALPRTLSVAVALDLLGALRPST